MKNKLSILFLFLTVCFYSQEIELQTDLIYKKERNYLLQEKYGDFIEVPYLKLTYYNKSVFDYYFYAPTTKPLSVSVKPENREEIKVYKGENNEIITERKSIHGNNENVTKIYQHVDGTKTADVWTAHGISRYNGDYIAEMLNNTERDSFNMEVCFSNYFFYLKSPKLEYDYRLLERLLKEQDLLNQNTKYQFKFFDYPNKEKIDLRTGSKLIGDHVDDYLGWDFFESELSKREIKKDSSFIFLKSKHKQVFYMNLKVLSYFTNKIRLRLESSFKTPKGVTITSCPEDIEYGCSIMDKTIKEQPLPLNIGRYKLYKENIVVKNRWEWKLQTDK